MVELYLVVYAHNSLCPFPPQESVVEVSYERVEEFLSVWREQLNALVANVVELCTASRQARSIQMKGESHVPLASLLW